MIWEIPLKYKKIFFYPEGVSTLSQAAQRGHGVSMIGDVWCLTDHDPELCAVKDAALIKGVWHRPPPQIPPNLSPAVILGGMSCQQDCCPEQPYHPPGEESISKVLKCCNTMQY